MLITTIVFKNLYLIMFKISRKFAAICSRREIYLIIFLGRGLSFNLDSIMLGVGRSRVSPREVRLPSKGEHHVCLRLTKRKDLLRVKRTRYTRAKEKSGGGWQLRRKIGTTECTTAAPIPWIRF